MVAESSPCKQFTIMSDTEIFSPEGARRRPGSARRPLSAITNNNPGAGLSPGKLAFPVKQEAQRPAPAPKQAPSPPAPAPKREEASNKAALVLGAVAVAAVVAAVLLAAPPSSSPSAAPHQPPPPAAAPAAEQHGVILDDGYEEGEWSELSPGHEDLFGGEEEEAPEDGLSFDDVPWAQSLISGPLQLDAGLLPGVDAGAVSEGMAGLYARLAPNGEMFLFADVVDQAPVAMLSLDGCATQHDLAPREPPAGCFAVYPSRGGWGVGCVGDAEEANDWIDALRQAPCE